MVKSNGVQTLVCITGIAFALAGLAAAQQPAEIIVRNGLIVTAEGRMEADVRIRGETIAEIGRDLASSAGAREIDASGMLLLPGAVDTHTHLNPEMPDPPRPKGNQDDYVSGSAAAFAAGATTISNFIFARIWSGGRTRTRSTGVTIRWVDRLPHSTVQDWLRD